MAFQQGAVVLAEDPFKADPMGVRPFVVVNTGKHPFHGRQYIVMTLTTRKHDDSIRIEDDFILRGNLDRRSYALPWSVTSVQASHVYKEVACLKTEVIEALVTSLVSYLAPPPTGDTPPSSPSQTVDAGTETALH